MSTGAVAKHGKVSLLQAVMAVFRRFAVPPPAFGLPAGAVLPTTSLPPAFSRRERAVVDAFFGRR